MDNSCIPDLHEPLRCTDKHYPLYVYSPLSTPLSIRLLSVTNTGKKQVPTYSLAEYSLADRPSYDALSYTCMAEGPPREGGEILVNGSSLPIGPNLRAALLHLHFLKWFGLIWIDVICIHQYDVQERTAQVNMMGKIFSSARLVTAWLGEHTHLEQARLVKIKDLVESLPRVERQQRFDTFETGNARKAMMGMRSTKYTDWMEVAELLMSKWFRRTWIIQEMVLAKEIVVYAGKIEFTWEKLYDAALLLHVVLQDISFRSFARDVAANLGFASAVFLAREAHARGTRWPFEKYLELSRAHEASDPRDKVFALVSMFTAGNLMHCPPTLRPDYEVSVVRAYTQCAEHLLHGPCGLEMISLVQDDVSLKKVGAAPQIARQIENLPSWVPDFSRPLYPSAIGGEARLHYNAACARAGQCSVVGNILHLESVLMGTVDVVGIPAKSTVFGYGSAEYFLKIVTGLDQQYITGEETMEALWRTLIANTSRGTYPAPDALKAEFILWAAHLLFLGKGLDFAASVEDFLATFGDQLSNIHSAMHRFEQASSEQPPAARRTIDSILDEARSFDGQSWSTCSGRLMIRIKERYIGLATESVSVGDELHLVAGVRVPLVLRRTKDDRFHFISEAYVHGLMDHPPNLLDRMAFQSIRLS